MGGTYSEPPSVEPTAHEDTHPELDTTLPFTPTSILTSLQVGPSTTQPPQVCSEPPTSDGPITTNELTQSNLKTQLMICDMIALQHEIFGCSTDYLLSHYPYIDLKDLFAFHPSKLRPTPLTPQPPQKSSFKGSVNDDSSNVGEDGEGGSYNGSEDGSDDDYAPKADATEEQKDESSGDLFDDL